MLRIVTLACVAAVLALYGEHGHAIDIGEMAPNFEVNGFDGESLRLSDYRGKKAVYLVFWNTWCSYCIKKAPRYKKLQEQYGDRVEIIAVNTTWSDSNEEIAQFQQRFEVNYPIAVDNGQTLTDQYAVHNVPTEFIIDIDGVIRYRDGVPKLLAAHIPDWFQPYSADMSPVQSCTR